MRTTVIVADCYQVWKTGLIFRNFEIPFMRKNPFIQLSNCLWIFLCTERESRGSELFVVFSM